MPDLDVLDLGESDSSLPVGIIQDTVSEDQAVISNIWTMTYESFLVIGRRAVGDSCDIRVRNR